MEKSHTGAEYTQCGKLKEVHTLVIISPLEPLPKVPRQTDINVIGVIVGNLESKAPECCFMGASHINFIEIHSLAQTLRSKNKLRIFIFLKCT